MRLIERYVVKLGATARACDVGCSHGDLLAALRAAYQCDVLGVELNPSMVARCAERGIKAVAGTLTQAKLEPSSFDLVTMTEYLEHEGDPRRLLEESRRITRNGGYLIVEIPLVTSLPSRLFRNYWAQLDLPRHLMFFTQETLQRMLHESGYEVVATQTLRGMLAPSVLNVLGYDGMGKLTARQLAAILVTETLMLPFQHLGREFVFVVARAVDKQAAKQPASRLRTQPPFRSMWQLLHYT
jgi:ubiquinone/menaquinone biosynthesis C-methylase UbiE